MSVSEVGLVMIAVGFAFVFSCATWRLLAFGREMWCEGSRATGAACMGAAVAVIGVTLTLITAIFE
jgi:hypothetical protein